MLGCSLCTRMTESWSQPCMSTPYSELWGGYSCFALLVLHGPWMAKKNSHQGNRDRGHITIPIHMWWRLPVSDDEARWWGDWWIRRCGGPRWLKHWSRRCEADPTRETRIRVTLSSLFRTLEMWRCHPYLFFSMRTNRVILGYSRAYPCWPSLDLCGCWAAGLLIAVYCLLVWLASSLSQLINFRKATC